MSAHRIPPRSTAIARAVPATPSRAPAAAGAGGWTGGIAWTLAGLAAAAAWLLLARGALDAGAPVCALREVFHVGCPTCGFTRALASLARGDLGASLALHPLALPIVAQLVAGWLAWGAGLLRGRALLAGRWVARAAAADAVAALVIWVIRLATGTLPV